MMTIRAHQLKKGDRVVGNVSPVANVILTRNFMWLVKFDDGADQIFRDMETEVQIETR